MKTYYSDFSYEVEYPTNGWLDGFTDRNNLKYKTPDTLEIDRFKNATTGTVKTWFEEVLKVIPEIKKISPKLIFNFDETMISFDKKLKVVVGNDVRRSIKKGDETNEHISCCVTINEAGDFFTPFIILQRKTISTTLQQLVFNGLVHIGGQENGWISQSGFFDWTKNFIKEVKEIKEKNNLSDNAILFLDGHNSRQNIEAL